MRTLLALFAMLALFGGSAFSMGPDQLAQGKAVYDQVCSHCHGIDMVNPGTSSFDLRKFPKDGRERFFQSVTKGNRDMPALGDILTPEEIGGVWHYVSTRGGKEEGETEQATATAEGADRAAGLAELMDKSALTVCLPFNGGAMSYKKAKSGRHGYDYAIAKEVAKRLGVALSVVWFETEPDEEENDPVWETYALLTYGLCDVAPGHILYASAFGEPPIGRAALPFWIGKPKTTARRHYVDLKPIAVTHPYARMEMGVVLRPDHAGRAITGLESLEGLRIGVEQGKLAGAILTAQAADLIAATGTMHPPGPGFLKAMDEDAFDAALIATADYDAHKLRHKITKLRLAHWRHPLGFNVGMALLTSKPALKALLDEVVAEMVADGKARSISFAERVHVGPPKEPWVTPPLTTKSLMQTQ